ncbi:hypothetical protein [Dictyobacter kobayashii]|uniref:Uncharacterized protein n=1 Tax=Dictyobacter kobayashii TaxID=2014872 RepID=A0A402AIJ7_9CHLR|nr:hypothetical protein [Dictyobacter kobayashii]GCE18951.1 hypothetical protein KDK_27510 [Dictyobacter kobayashii]
MERQTYMLVPSTTRGRYALDRADGADVSSNQYIAIKIGSRWVPGTVEFARPNSKGPVPGTCVTESVSNPLPVGACYYFISNDGDIVGLCVGMRVRIL